MPNSRNLLRRLLGCLSGAALLSLAVWFGVSPPTASLPGPGAVEVSEAPRNALPRVPAGHVVARMMRNLEGVYLCPRE